MKDILHFFFRCAENLKNMGKIRIYDSTIRYIYSLSNSLIMFSTVSLANSIAYF